MDMTLIILLSLAASGVFADDHILRYYFTGVSETGLGFPEYTVAAYVDDKLIHQYSSDTGKIGSVPIWMNKEEPEYWGRQLWRAKNNQPVFRDHVRIGMRRFNQTKGFHSAQWMYGCELRDDGTTVGYSQMGYDGRDVLFLDEQRAIYIPTVPEAELTAQDWNRQEKRWGDLMKFNLEKECIPQVKKLINFGREYLERRVRPEVKVGGRPQSDGITRLHCLVYGFHPRAVDVNWVRNEVDHVDSDEMSPILPHPDGTYQIRVSAEVPTREGDTYSCHVDHSSLGDEILIVKWEPDQSPPIAVIVGAIIGSLLITAAIIGVSFYMRNKRIFRASDNSDTPNDSSINSHI